MRTIIRLAILALAAFGAKALYDIIAPRKEELRRTGSDFVDRAGTAAREVRAKVSDATGQVVTTAQQGATEVVAAVAKDQANEVQAAARDAKDQALETKDQALDDATEASPAPTSSAAGSAKAGAKR